MEKALYEITPMRQFARLTLSAPLPEDTTIMNFQHLLEKHQMAPAILAVINGYLQEKGLSLRQGTSSMPPSFMPPARPRTRKENVIPRCIRPRKVTNISLARSLISAPSRDWFIMFMALRPMWPMSRRSPSWCMSCNQASVLLRESALSWADEKHSSADHAVRPVESVDGSKTADGYG